MPGAVRRLGRKSVPHLLAGLAIIAAGTAAAAERPAQRFRIRSAPVGQALVAAALQGGVSLGGEIGICKGRAPTVSGRMSLDEALSRLLAGSGCGFVRIDPATIVIRAGRELVPAAAPKPPPSNLVLGEVVVTFPRRAELVGRTPYAVTASTGAQLRADRINDLGALALGIAGMTTTNLGPGRNKIFLRGLSDGAFTGATQSTVALYLDDTPVTYNAPDPDLRLVDVERVEVLRGPQGTLYGGGSIGGIVKILTHRPDLDDWSGSVTVGGALTYSGEPSNTVEATLNAPLSAGRAAARATVYRDQWGGYIDDQGLGRRNVNRGLRSGGRVAVRAAFARDWSATVTGVHQSINTRDTQYSSVGLPRLRRDNALAEPHDNDFDSVSITVEGEGSWGRITASSTRLVHQLDSRYDATDAVTLFGGAGPTAFDETRHIDLWVSEATWALPAGKRFQGLFGVFRSGGTTLIGADMVGMAGSANSLYRERRDDEVNELAAYGELTAHVTDRLSLTAGARWFRFGYDVASDVTQGPTIRSFVGRGETAGVSPKLLVSFQANDRLLGYVQVSQGYRAGGFNTAGLRGESFTGGLGEPSREYGPDRLWNYEVGLKAKLFDERLQLRAAGYLVQWNRIQTDQFLDSGLPYTLNVGNGRNHGLELETTWRASQRLELKLAGLLNDPRLTRINPSFTAQSDAGLPGVPTVSASAGLTYRRPFAAGDLTAKLAVAYVGRSTLTFDSQQVYRMGDYVSSRASLGWSNDRWRLTAWADNLFNVSGNTFAYGNPFRIGREREATPQRPRTIGVEIGANF